MPAASVVTSSQSPVSKELIYFPMLLYSKPISVKYFSSSIFRPSNTKAGFCRGRFSLSQSRVSNIYWFYPIPRYSNPISVIIFPSRIFRPSNTKAGFRTLSYIFCQLKSLNSSHSVISAIACAFLVAS